MHFLSFWLLGLIISRLPGLIMSRLPSNSVKVDQKDAANLLVLSSHLQLQKEGFLSTWTNSFVGPWDPSQGLHNPGSMFYKHFHTFQELDPER